MKKAAPLKMTPEAGPPVEGYIPKAFEDAEPEGEEEIVRDADLANDIENMVAPPPPAQKKIKKKKIKKKKCFLMLILYDN